MTPRRIVDSLARYYEQPWSEVYGQQTWKVFCARWAGMMDAERRRIERERRVKRRRAEREAEEEQKRFMAGLLG